MTASCTAAVAVVMSMAAPASVQVPCTDVDRAAMADAEVRLNAIDDRAAAARLADGSGPEACVARRLAQMAVAGWVEARSLTRVGGDPAELGRVNEILGSLERLGSDPATSFDQRLEISGADNVRRAESVADVEDGAGFVRRQHVGGGVYRASRFVAPSGMRVFSSSNAVETASLFGATRSRVSGSVATSTATSLTRSPAGRFDSSDSSTPRACVRCSPTWLAEVSKSRTCVLAASPIPGWPLSRIA